MLNSEGLGKQRYFMRKIIIYTQAYNSDGTLCRAIDSVLTQTYKEFEYILVNNGSTDMTGDIIKEYASKDKRITPLANKENHVWEPGNNIIDTINHFDDDYILCWFDADDELHPQFFEKMVLFMEQNNLDIAICGNDFIDGKKSQHIGRRTMNEDMILAKDSDFNNMFSQYHQFIRTAWAKFYSFSILRNIDFERINRISYGWDTYFVLETIKSAHRVGILSESLHKYYVNPKSMSYRFDQNRIISDQILFDETYNLLVSKCGTVSNKNLNFLMQVYLNAIMDTMNVLVNAQMDFMEKLDKLRDIFQSRHTQELIKWPGLKQPKNELLQKVAVWILSKEDAKCSAALDIVADIFNAMCMHPAQIANWKDEWVFLILAKLKNRKSDVPSKIDEQILSITAKSPLLSGLNVGFMVFFQNIIFSILQNEEYKALLMVKDFVARDIDFPEEYIDAFLELGLNLSAQLNQKENFVYFKKLQISVLLELSRFDEVRNEIEDWRKLLPEDLDFIELSNRLPNEADRSFF